MATDFFQKVLVSNFSFGNFSRVGTVISTTIIDGITVSKIISNPSAVGPADVVIPFKSQGLLLVNEGTSASNVIEYSFDGINLFGDMIPGTPSAALAFDNRQINSIWFRIKDGGTASTIRVECWAVPS